MGDPAPGTEPGTVFAFTGSIYVTAVPSIDAQGRVSFVAMLGGPSVTPANRSGVFSGVPGAMALAARAGAQAPGYAPGVTFHTFPFEFALVPPVVGGGRFAFRGTVTGPGVTEDSNEGIWTGGAAPVALFLREQTPVPDMGVGVEFTSNFGFDMNESGDVLVTATIAGPGVTTTNDEGFWSDRTGSLRAVLREGDPAPDSPTGVVVGGAGQFIGTGYTFQEVQWNDISDEGVVSTVTGPGVDTFSNETLFSERAGEMRLLAREGEDAPGAGHNVEFGGNSVTADFDMLVVNELGHSAFIARLGGAISTTYALFSDHMGELTHVVRPLEPAPGTTQQFGIIVDPALSPSGRLAFRAALSGAGTWPPLGIWWDQNTPGSLALLALPGQALPERPGTTLASAIQIVGYSDGLLVFRADVDDPQAGVVPALIAADPQGAQHVVVAHGDLFDVHGTGGDFATVTRIDVGGVNAAGQIALRLEFGDGRFGFYRVSPDAATDVGLGVDGLRGLRATPNPFGSTTRIDFDLARGGRVGVDVYDVSGRFVARLLDKPLGAGRQTLSWDGRDRSGAPVSSGVYWARFNTTAGASAVRLVRLQSN